MRKRIDEMTHRKLIEKINVLGPWSHGYFDLGNGLIIEDRDYIQKKRLFFYRKYFIDIISNFYKKETLNNKTLCDIGCNAGYFLYELFKKFNFKQVMGLEPRRSNLAKARFIAKYFKLSPDRYKLKKFDILTRNKKLPSFDIVIMPSVLHHLDNHFHALSNAYKMTRELCIIDSLILPDGLNTPDIAQKLELKDDFYKNKKIKNKFGIVGYKIETDKLDGSTYHTGMVGIPTLNVLKMMLYHVGFSEVKIYRDCEQLKRNVYNEKLYREVNTVIMAAYKRGNKRKKILDYNNNLKDIWKQEFNTYIPTHIIRPLYKLIGGNYDEKELPATARLIYESELHFYKKRGEAASRRLAGKIGNRKYYSIIKTFKHSPRHKITFEYAKTCYHKRLLEKAEDIAKKLIKTVNLDWRTVYKTYYLLALINFKRKNEIKAEKYNKLSLCAFDSYSPALELKKRLSKEQK